MSNYQALQSIDFQGSIEASAAKLSPESQRGLSEESWNCILAGNGYNRGFNGFTSQGANTGSRKMMPVGKTWAGIKDNGATVGTGNFFEDIGQSRWGIGSGIPHIEGTNVTSWTLSTLLQVSVKSSGSYAAPVQAGLSQPSSPDIGIVQTVGDVSKPISAKIERRRPSTGARSLASPTSAVIVPASNRVRVTFPTASTGQTHWRVYFTFQGFGGTGIHYLAKYSTYTDIPESTVSAGTVDGIARSLEFNFQDGDLIPVEASYDDYTPPAATHALKLQNILNLVGCYSDAVTDPTSTNPGTCIAVSKINNYESYIPTHLLFLPEQVVDVLARPIDDFGYIACENSIHAIQYVGYRGEELPPCTITTVLPDIGIQYPHNWCHFRGRLLIYTAEGNLLMMGDDGSFDGDFAAPIRSIIQNWSTANTIVGYDPKNDLIIIANGKRILCYNLSGGSRWRQIWLPDFSVTGDVYSCTTSKRRLYITVNNASSYTAYSFDTGSANAPMSFVSNWQNLPGGNLFAKDIYEMAISAETSVSTSMAVCLAKNLQKAVFRQISVTASSANIADAESKFYSGLVGKKVIIFGTDINGAGTVYIRGLVSAYNNTGSITLTDLNGSALSPAATLTNLLMFVGEWVAVSSIAAAKHFANFFPRGVIEARSYQVAVWTKGTGTDGNVLTADLVGDSYPSSRMS